MRLLVTTIRLVAVLAGLFLVLGSAMEISGVIPYSNGTPPLQERLLSALVPFGFGLILLAPQRRFLKAPQFQILGAAHLLLVGAATYRAVETVSLVRLGQLDPISILAAIVAVAVPALSGGALWVQRQPPNNSFKPKPLRGSA